MNVYLYQAALLCEACGTMRRQDIRDGIVAGIVPTDATDESSYDSDDYPKGPHAGGGGEADCPQSCDHCDRFLENPLTKDGVEYVKEALRDMPKDRLGEWREFYLNLGS